MREVATENAPSPVRVALVSTGLRHTQRGYETFIRDLYDCLSASAGERYEITLYQGSGAPDNPHVKTLPTLRRNHPLLRALVRDELTRYRIEQYTFALSGWLSGAWRRADVIHFCDPGFGNALLRLRRYFSQRFQLLFANCGPANPHDYARYDHIQEFTPQYLEAAKTVLPEAAPSLSLIPMGVELSRFQAVADKFELRQKWRVPDGKFVVLSVASLDEPYKRLDFLIDAVADLDDEDCFLLLVGQNQGTLHSRNTLAKAQAQLPGRFMHMTVPYDAVPQMYALSDLFVLPSLQEGFGKVYLEAMAAGVPMLCHDCPNTRWIAPAEPCLVDMESEEALKGGVNAMRDGSLQSGLAVSVAADNRTRVAERFQWRQLAPEYLAMYERALARSGR